MKKLILIFIAGTCILSTACQNVKKETEEKDEFLKLESQFELPDSLSSKRISFALDLRGRTAARCWPEFGEKRTEGTLIYFNEDQSEIFFPSSNVINALGDYEEYSKDYLLTARTDSIPFHMEVMVSFDPSDSLRFYYEHPVEQYLSVEEIGNFIPSVHSTEMWATMVVHEMFHHFQYNNPRYSKYAESEIGPLTFNINDLITLCQEDDEFLSLIQIENDYLMKAIAAQDNVARDTLIANYLVKRKMRMDKYGAKYPYLEKNENYYMIQEGSARYAEYNSMFILKEFAKSTDAPKIEGDPRFSNYTEFQEIDLESDAFNYLVYAGTTDYHYTIGFNTMRLLDKLSVDYKGQLLNSPEKGLHEYLEDYINTLPNNSYKQ